MKQSMNHSFMYHKFGCYLQEINRGGFKMPGNSIFQWVIYFYVKFLQSV